MNKGGCKCDKVKGKAKRPRHGKQDKFKNITHAIFDCDGTLLDSEEAYHKLIRNLCKKYNKDYNQSLQEQCYGRTEHETCVKVCTALNIPIPLPQFQKELADICDIELPKAAEKPGVQRLLRHLVKNGIPCAAASNSGEELLKVYTKKRPEIFKYFHHIVSATDKEVKQSKPAPDLYQLAAQRFDEPKPNPAHCLIFEDTLVGVQAGLAAGMQVVMVPAPRIPKEDTKIATYVVPNLTHFKPELFGLPPFDDGLAPLP